MHDHLTWFVLKVRLIPTEVEMTIYNADET